MAHYAVYVLPERHLRARRRQVAVAAQEIIEHRTLVGREDYHPWRILSSQRRSDV